MKDTKTENGKVYVLIKEGVYQHGIFGIFRDPDIALKNTETAMKLESDNYHSINVYEIEIGKLRQVGDRYNRSKDPEWKLYAVARKDHKGMVYTEVQ